MSKKKLSRKECVKFYPKPIGNLCPKCGSIVKRNDLSRLHIATIWRNAYKARTVALICTNQNCLCKMTVNIDEDGDWVRQLFPYTPQELKAIEEWNKKQDEKSYRKNRRTIMNVKQLEELNLKLSKIVFDEYDWRLCLHREFSNKLRVMLHEIFDYPRFTDAG